MANTVTNNISNTTYEYNSSYKRLTVTCNDGYEFKGTPKVTYTKKYSTTQTVEEMTVKNNTVATFDFYSLQNNTQIIADGETVEQGATGVTVNCNIDNTNCTNEYTDGKVTIKVTGTRTNPKQYRLLDVVATYNGTNTPLQVTNNDTENSATGTFEVPTGTEITVTGRYVLIVTVETILTNCTGNFPEYYEQGATVDLMLTADNGKSFTEIPTLTYIKLGSPVTENFILSDDKRTATINTTLPTKETEQIYSITIKGNAQTVTPVAINYGTVNVYLTNVDELTQFSKIRFATYESGYYLVFEDYAEYINRLKRIYCDIEQGATDVMYFGNKNSQIQTHNPKSTFVTLDFGNIEIPTHNNDTTDYESEITLFVPFVGNVNVPVDYMGQTVNLTVVVDVVTGKGLYKLTCNDILIISGECTPSSDVLYRTSQMQIVGGDEWNETRYLGLQPYISVKWYESKNKTGRNNDNKRGLISSFTGFNSFDDITPVATPEMLTDEQEMIYSELKTGVYIQ